MISFQTSEFITDKQVNAKFRSFIKSLKFKPEKCRDIIELNNVIELVRKEINAFEEVFDVIPPSAYVFLSQCSLAQRKLLHSKIEY